MVSKDIVGRFDDLTDLIQDLEAMTRIISITSISGSPTKSTDSSEFRISIEFEIFQVTL